MMHVQDNDSRQENNFWGKSLSTEDTMHHIFMLRGAFQANLSIGELQLFKPALDAKGNANPNVYYTSNLTSDHIEALHKEEIESVCKIIEECYG